MTTATAPAVTVLPDADALATTAAEAFIIAVGEAVATRGACHVALAGGSTPEGLYRRLAQPGYAERVPWEQVHIWFGDERGVPPDHADSNYRMARQALLDHVPLPPAQVHRMAGEDDPATAAAAYAEQLRSELPAADGIPVLDLVLLGLGPDGHIASLFPDTAALTATEPAVANWVPKLETWRLTLTYPVLNAARRVWLLAAGSGKAAVVAQALDAPHGEGELPVQRLNGGGEYRWFLDGVAAGR